MIKQLIFGLGTGRCGTFSLTKLLNAQPSITIGHEACPLPWIPNYDELSLALDKFLATDSLRVGDVAYWWLPYVAAILADYHDAKFICLYRARELVTKSFFNNTPGRNLWTDPKSKHWKEEWEDRDTDVYFPRYNIDKLEAIGEYWDEYWERANTWAGLCPNNFGFWHVDILNSEEGQSDIFDFIGIPKQERKYDVGVRINVSEQTLTTKSPVIDRGIPCNFCDENKADWRLTNEKLNAFVYTCDPCEKYDKKLGRFQNSVIV